MDMIETVARAMFHAECEPHKATTGYGDTFGWDDAMPAVRERLTASARAAIEAMREPTEVMQKAGYAVTVDDELEVWQAMIDAALSE